MLLAEHKCILNTPSMTQYWLDNLISRLGFMWHTCMNTVSGYPEFTLLINQPGEANIRLSIILGTRYLWNHFLGYMSQLCPSVVVVVLYYLLNGTKKVTLILIWQTKPPSVYFHNSVSSHSRTRLASKPVFEQMASVPRRHLKVSSQVFLPPKAQEAHKCN